MGYRNDRGHHCTKKMSALLRHNVMRMARRGHRRAKCIIARFRKLLLRASLCKKICYVLWTPQFFFFEEIWLLS